MISATPESRVWATARPVLAGLILVFLLALVIRASLFQTARFTGDESRFFSIVADIHQGKTLPLLGPPLSGGEAKHPGPAFYYLMALSQWISPTPEAANLWVAILGALSVVLFWDGARRLLGTGAATFASVLMAFSPWSVLYADRIWNSNVVGFPVAVVFWVVAILKGNPRSRWVALGIASAILIPQFHMSAPIVWVGAGVLLGTDLRKVDRRWVTLGVAMGLLAYAPMIVSETITHGANLRHFLAESSRHSSGSFLRIPVAAFRFLTLDVSYQELAGYWAPIGEMREWKTAFAGSEIRPFHPLRLAALLASIGLAASAWRALLRGQQPVRRAALAAILSAMALMLLTRKPYYPHYFQPALPFLFMGLACLWAQDATRRARGIIAGLAVIQALGSLDAVWTISHRLDARNGLKTQRSIVARVMSDAASERWPPPARVELASDFPIFPESYQVLATQVLGAELTFVAPGSDGTPIARYFLSKDGDPVSVRRVR